MVSEPVRPETWDSLRMFLGVLGRWVCVLKRFNELRLPLL